MGTYPGGRLIKRWLDSLTWFECMSPHNPSCEFGVLVPIHHRGGGNPVYGLARGTRESWWIFDFRPKEKRVPLLEAGTPPKLYFNKGILLRYDSGFFGFAKRIEREPGACPGRPLIPDLSLGVGSGQSLHA